MSKNLWMGAVVIVVIILAGWYLARPKQEATPTSVSTPVPAEATTSQATEGAMMKEENSVEITSVGFSPKDITIKVGESVTWMNSDSSMHNVSSAPHPTHTAYPPLNLGNIEAKGKVSLMFDKAGTYKYHDHLNPSLFGSVTVQ